MKKCSWCGKEYPDSAVECSIDRQPLIGGDAEVETASVEANDQNEFAAAIPPSRSTAPVLQTGINERRLRILELVLVCAIAFGSSFLVSTFQVLGLAPERGPWGNLGWSYFILHEGAALVLLWYVLMRRSQSFRDLGLSWRLQDLIWSIPLVIGAHLAVGIAYGVIYATHLTLTDPSSATEHVARGFLGAGISIITIPAILLNPFFEEMIVRGYLMTEVRQLTGSVWKAVVLSTLVQMSFHFYQGVPLGFALGANFLLFSIYYAKTSRLAPVILAHFFLDLASLLVFASKHT